MPIPFLQIVLSDKGKKNNNLHDTESSAYGVFDTNYFIDRICQRLQTAVYHDPYNQ